MATFYRDNNKFEAEFYFDENNGGYYIRLDKTVAAKLLLFHEIFWETYELPDRYGHRQYLSMDPEADKCLIGVYMDEDIPIVWNSSFYDETRVTYNTFVSANSAEEFCKKYNFNGLAHECWVINEIFYAIDYFYGIEDARILGRFAPEYVFKFIEKYAGWYTPNKVRDLFEFTPRDLVKFGIVKPGREPEPEED